MLTEVARIQVVAVTAPVDDPLVWAAEQAGKLVYHKIDPGAVCQLEADVIVSAQNYTHISEAAREAAVHGAIGYHPSLLPRWRGRQAVEATIKAGDAIAGGTVYRMDDGFDTGPIIRQDWCHVEPGWTAKDLWRECLFPMGLRLLREVLEPAAGRLTARPWPLKHQAESVATTC